MKKIMIAACAIALAGAVHAANWNWAATSGYLVNGQGQTTADYRITSDATAYLFDAGTFSQAQLIAALQDKTYASLEAAYTAKGIAAAPTATVTDGAKFAKTADFAYGDTSSTYNFYIAVVADAMPNDVFVSASVAKAASALDEPSTISIASMSNPSKAAVKTGAFTEAGWYQTAAVPEPTSGLLLLLGVAGLALRRRRA